ncbi:methyl-accepting chemotaxis protein [Neptunomonas marina]|uniref:Methyl-accepting chemotaxis protein n=1 Tax=Neptunomonas marina TaxID=1815562 RepID=A0A437QC92_9GAMM|nr:methyl-accepting chemotaxis protein [Neptunomonas marina]RVU32136.1 methyl-accepting chemotaxis protein [Neptunomonas marina]
MKVSHKLALVASTVVVLVFSLFSWIQYQSVKNSLVDAAESSTQESMVVLSHQITNWLNGKLALINMMAETIDADFSGQTIQQTFDTPLLKDEFILIFGGLDTDGARITNDPSWNPANWDARKRPWYPYARGHDQAVLTEPYPDAATGEILISAVAKFKDKGSFKGAFGGDLSLATVADALNTMNFDGAGYAFLLDASGKIISHPDEAFNGKAIGELINGKQPSFTGGFQPSSIGGEDVFVTFKELQGLPGSNWYVAAVLNKDMVMAPATKFGISAVVGTIVSIILTSLALYLVSTKLLQPMLSLRESIRELNSGDGDLTHRLSVETKDEFGALSNEFNEFLDFLQKIIHDVKEASRNIRSSTDQTAHAANSASNQLNEQLNELDQLAAAMHEMSATATEVASSAQQTASAAQSADDAAMEGASVVSRTTTAMESLVGDMDGAVSTVSELASYSNNIESILTVITGIAEQTNLLALNAAIEAARAGDAGRGFAVVADEVRALASRTQQSTEEIQKMIGQLQGGVTKAEQTISRGRDVANEACSIAQNANQSLENIRDGIRHISEMTIQIATAAEEQSATSDEINRNTSNIRDISQMVSESAQDQAMLCNSMVEQTSDQDRTLGKFKV